MTVRVLQERMFEVSSIGRMYWKSLILFRHHLEDADGNRLELEELEPNQPFCVVFKSGTGFTRTSAVRVL